MPLLRLALPNETFVFMNLQSQKELHKKHHDTADGRIRVWLGIRQIMNSTDALLLKTRDTAQELGTGIHMVLLAVHHLVRMKNYIL